MNIKLVCTKGLHVPPDSVSQMDLYMCNFTFEKLIHIGKCVENYELCKFYTWCFSYMLWRPAYYGCSYWGDMKGVS